MIETSGALVQPVVVLVVWSMVMWVWMYATRIPAIQAMNLEMDPELPAGQQMSKLPSRVRWKADNYNHLMEQPTIFYAITLALAVIGAATDVNVYAAWAYVILRIVHSLFQSLVNKIELRFGIFALSNIPLAVLAFGGLSAAFA